MAGSTPPRQPHLGRDHGSEDSDPWQDPRPRVDESARVPPASEDEPREATPQGSRFAAWRAHRHGSSAASDDPEPVGPPPSPETENPVEEHPAAEEDTVVAFPPSSYRRRRRHRWVALLAALLAAALLIGIMFFSPVFAAREFTVSGARLTDPQNVQDALRQFEGVPLTRLSKDRVRQAVGDVPQVNSVDVVLQPPHTITVQLHERVGVATVKDGSQLVLVDSQGKQLATYAPSERPQVPTVDGGPEVLSTEKFAAISDVLASLPAGMLTQLDSAAAPSESSVELTFKDGRKAIWGDAVDSELKARVLAVLVSDEATSSATVYDVSAPLYPTVK